MAAERVAFERKTGETRWCVARVSERSLVGVQLWASPPGTVVEFDGYQYKWEEFVPDASGT